MAEGEHKLKVISYMRSPFLYKNGTPRQPVICRQVTGEITVEKSIFNNPEHSLEGLEQFSHIWIFFIFHKNNNAHSKAKVKPPRLDGRKTGVFSTRSPYRPNNIGLTLAKIESVKGATLTVSGIDILDGTPIIDLKPYIPDYDNPAQHAQDLDEEQSDNDVIIDSIAKQKLKTDLKDHRETKDLVIMQQENIPGKTEIVKNATDCCDESSDFQVDVSDGNENTHQSDDKACFNSSKNEKLNHTSVKENDHFEEKQEKLKTETSDVKCSTADWITKSPVSSLVVRFTPSAEEQLKLFNSSNSDVDFRFKFLKSIDQAKQSIIDILHEDPRSTYRRKHCEDSLYYFTLDVMHITCWFDENLVEIVKIKPVGKVEKLKG